MEQTPPSILIVEDSQVLREVYSGYLATEPYRVAAVETGAEALAALARHPPHAMLLDLRLPDMDGMEILRHVGAQRLPTAVVIITGHGSVDLAVDAMREGAFDFIEKPFNARRLRVTLRNALERQRLSSLLDSIQETFDRDRYHGFIGASLAMQAVYRVIDSAAASKATIFITGESGTGKEVCAEAIHRQGPRREAPFIALNCGAIPHDLMESEIFGHLRGAFTGAARDRVGAAGQADGGTLFLDEIGEMDLDLQTKLLRFVQTGSFQRVGSTRQEAVDVRFVCATNRDPLKEVAAGRFREDLYYRLHVIPIELPPLRARQDDILLLAEHFLQGFAAEEGKAFQRFAPATAALLRDYHWPGNVRQLQNVIRNVVVLHQGETVDPEMLPPPLSEHLITPPRATPAEPAQPAPAAAATTTTPDPGIQPLWRVEREAIERAIAHCDGNIPRAAALLEVNPSTLYRKRQAWQSGDG
ncbi:MAG: sigma-54-dependent Fis family transcriptional regulator [Marichromatium sp.]|nr:sigma-54-dependent Fis family transcriptional regulator [Marichromatium sp.]